jgi:hypothetical protein
MNDKRYPNGEAGTLLGFRRSGASAAVDAIEALAAEGLFELADDPYTPYVPVPVPPGVIGVGGDYSYPNMIFSPVTGFRRTLATETPFGDIGLISDEMIFGPLAGPTGGKMINFIPYAFHGRAGI